MEQQELFYPDLLVTIGDYQFDQGITLKACIDRNRPFDWGKISFSNPYKEHIQVQAQDEISISLGYDGDLQEVFIGNIVDGYDGYNSMNEIMFKDRTLKLEKTYISGTFIGCTPQDILLEGLRIAGIEEYHLSQTQYVPLTVTIKNKNMIQVLKQINTAWGLDIKSGFIKGVFYWGEIPEQSEILEFEYANNIISLDKVNNQWELVTVSIPSLQHSQKIQVTHPRLSGIFETEKIIFMTNDAGFIRTRIYFEGTPL